jgi:hypothetical protein
VTRSAAIERQRKDLRHRSVGGGDFSTVAIPMVSGRPILNDRSARAGEPIGSGRLHTNQHVIAARERARR